jgi:hypothetical protein
MTLIQLERILTGAGFKVTKYLSPEEGRGFAATLPSYPIEQDVVITKNEDRFNIILSTPLKKTGINPISSIQTVDKTKVLSIIEQFF